MNDMANIWVTIGVFLVASFSTIAPMLASLASLLAIIFWIPRIKREIKQNHNNSIWAYIKSVFKK
jgi:uncharacterized membrane protein YhiD involved in acid resistance